MELRHLRYFVAVGEEQHYGRASRRLRVAQPALSRQIQDLEEEVGFKLFDRLPRGVKLNPAGKLFLEDARRILQEVSDAAVRAGRVARGRSGTLRVGFTENSSWRGVVPDSFRRFREQQPDAELQLHPAPSLDQMEAIRSGRLDAGFVNFMPKADPELDQLTVANQHVELALPKRHPLAKLKKLRLRDLVDVAFVWFPRWASPAFYDQRSLPARSTASGGATGWDSICRATRFPNSSSRLPMFSKISTPRRSFWTIRTSRNFPSARKARPPSTPVVNMVPGPRCAKSRFAPIRG
jgi:DNA-binding transcriptional LysR family regulator